MSISRPDHLATLGFLGRLRSELATLPTALQDVAAYIVERPELAARATIAELAATTRTSVGTVNRLCHALDLRGYSDLKLALATEIGREEQASRNLDLGVEIGPTTPLEQVATTLAAIDARAMQETAARIDPSAVGRIATMLLSARRIELFGIGGSSFAAEELVFRLRRLGLAAWASTEVHSGLTSVALLGPDDVVLVISHSGRTTEAVEVLAAAAARGTPTIALTNTADSPVGVRAGQVLTTTVQETGFRSEALAARHSQLLLIDILFVAVAQHGGDDAAQALTTTTSAVSGHLTPPEPPNRSKRRRRVAILPEGDPA